MEAGHPAASQCISGIVEPRASLKADAGTHLPKAGCNREWPICNRSSTAIGRGVTEAAQIHLSKMP
jgi:hypothetical protein